MALNWPQSGVNNVAEFQASGHTLAVGASTTVRLKFVASSITVSAGGGAGSVTFYDGSHNSQAFSLASGATARFTGKFLTFATGGNTSALVEVTNIPSGSYNVPDFADMKR